MSDGSAVQLHVPVQGESWYDGEFWWELGVGCGSGTGVESVKMIGTLMLLKDGLTMRCICVALRAVGSGGSDWTL
jgi:hypothetical protein